MRIAVEGAGYGSAAGALRVGNELAAQQYGTLTQKLAAYAGMAGDDYTSREFAQQYDAAAQEAVDGLDDVVDAFATLAGLTRQSHRNHRHANQAAAYGHPAPDLDDFEPGTVDVGSVRLASSLGANAADVPQFWNDILDHLEGYAWPDADTGRLRDAAATWWSAASGVEELASSCDTAVARLETQESPEVPLAVQAVRDLRGAVLDLSAEMRSVGDACDEYAAGVEEHRAIIRGIIADMAVEAGLSIVAGAVVGFFTFGGGAAAGGAVAGWRIATAAKKILTALRALHDLARVRAAARLTAVVERIGPVRSVLLRLKRAKRMRIAQKAVGHAGDDLGKVLDRADLNPARLANLARHAKRMPAELPTVVTRGADRDDPPDHQGAGPRTRVLRHLREGGGCVRQDHRRHQDDVRAGRHHRPTSRTSWRHDIGHPATRSTAQPHRAESLGPRSPGTTDSLSVARRGTRGDADPS